MNQQQVLPFIMALSTFFLVGCTSVSLTATSIPQPSPTTPTPVPLTPTPLPPNDTPTPAIIQPQSGEMGDETGTATIPSKLDREDGAFQVDISVSGSLQNPAWSPDNDLLLFTRFRNGYNMEPADLLIVDLGSNAIRTLMSDGSGNVNLPGSSWNSLTQQIVFSSSREPHDEIFVIDDYGSNGDEIKVTDRATLVSYEPSFSADGQWVVFETHGLDVQDNGILTKYRIDGTEPYQNLTNPDEDSRQPNWSPTEDKIVYQKLSAGQWDIWTMNADGTNHQQVTNGPGNKTDVSFSPDGQWLVYSSEELGLEFANLFIIPILGGNSIRVTRYEGYDGAPSWSGDGQWIAFESYPGDPDDSPGTAIWIIEVPEEIRAKLLRIVD